MTKQFVLEARKPNMHIAMSQSYLLVQKACKYLDPPPKKKQENNCPKAHPDLKLKKLPKRRH